MQIIQPAEQLLDDDHDILLGDGSRAHEIGATAAGAEFHDNPQFGTLQIRPVVSGHVGRIKFRQDSNLLDDIFDFVLGILNVDDFDCDRGTSSLIDSMVS